MGTVSDVYLSDVVSCAERTERVCFCFVVIFVYLWFFAEAEPGESHELALAVGQGILGVDDGSHAGGMLVGMCREERG